MQTTVLLANLRRLWKAQSMHLWLQAVHVRSLALLHSISSGLNEEERVLKFLCWNSLTRPLLGVREEGLSWSSAGSPAVRTVSQPLLHLSWWLFLWSALVPGRQSLLEGILSPNEQVCCWLSNRWSSSRPGMGLLLDRQSLPTSYGPQEHTSVRGNISQLVCGVRNNDAGRSCLTLCWLLTWRWLKASGHCSSLMNLGAIHFR